MRINVWGINYYPELTGIGVYNTELCEYLAECNDDVSVTTGFSYYPHWTCRPEDKGRIYRTEKIGGVEVNRCWHFIPKKPTPLTRMVHEATFVFSSFLRQVVLPAPDLFIVVSPPLLLGAAAWIVSAVKQVPFVFHVQDLQPDAAKGLNMLKNNSFLSLLYRLENLAYTRAKLVSAISPDMRQAIHEKGIDESKIICFPNWIDPPAPNTRPGPGRWKESRGIDTNTAIISYAGNLGAKQGLDLLVEAARLFEDSQNVLVVLAGDGSKRKELEELVRKTEVKNVRLEPVLTEEEHTSLLIDSDISVITMLPGTGKSFLPSKLLKILALGRPVITNADSDSALYRAVSEGEFGLTVSECNPQALASAIMELLADKDSRRKMGEAGIKYISRFEKSRVLPAYRGTVQKLIESAASSGS